jgi:hypothetical protein
MIRAIHAVDIKLTVEMVDFMLKGLRQQSFGFHSYFLPLQVSPLGRYGFGAIKLAHVTRNAQAAFGDTAFSSRFNYLGINHYHVVLVRETDYNHPEGHANLGRRQTYPAFVGVQGFPHIGHKLFNRCVDSTYLFCLLS